MNDIILTAENISKQYRLGVVGTGTFSHDLNRWWHTVRGKEDPYLKVGAVNDRSAKVSSDYVWALKNIYFDVKRGEVLGIIGKNGAGKSTLLKILSRVTSPTTGVIKSRGRIASLLEVGTGFHPELTGRENIFLNGAILGMSKAEIQSKLDEIIDFSGCEMYIDTPTKRYSSGMTVRLAFAVAAHLEPEILVVDEVLAVGDAEFQKKAIGKMQDISQGEGRTVLFVSHNMASVKKLCTRAVLLENGLVKYDGQVEDCIENYLSINQNEVKKKFKPIKQNNFCLQSFRLEDGKGNEIDTIVSGANFVIKAEGKTLDNSHSMGFGISIYSGTDELKLNCTTELKATSKMPSESGKIAFTFKLDKWPLTNGLFYLNCYFKQNKNIIFHGKKICHINSVAGDFYNTGKLPNSKNVFLLDYGIS